MENTYPLTQSQLGIFIECQAQPALTKYNLACQMKFSADFSAYMLESSLKKIFEKRKTLHTRIVMNDEGEPRQLVDMAMEIPVGKRKMSESEMAEYVEHDFMRPFELLGKEPLCRFEIIETEKGLYLLCDIHHIISDGLSFFTLFPKKDLVDALEGKELVPEEKTLQEYAVEEQQMMKTPLLAQAEDFYKKKYSGMEFTHLADTFSSSAGRALEVSETQDKASVLEWCEKHGVKPNILFMAAFSLVLSRLSRQQKTAYASVRHGRYDKALKNTYGMFVKTVSLIADANPETKVVDFLKNTDGEWQITRTMDNFSFPMFCREIQSVPQIFFSYQGDKIDREFEYYEGKIKFRQLPRTTSDVDLICFVYQHADSFEIQAKTSDALHDEAFLRQVCKAVINCTSQLMANYDNTLKEISIVSEDEKNELIALGKGEEMEYDRSETLVDLFEKQARQTPDAQAVVFKNRIYTYREIDDITSRLAIHLQQKYGVDRETVVGVMIDRSEWMVIYPLAVMKAGGAYMPLDFHFPEDRLSYMIEDAGVDLILSEDSLVATALPKFKGYVINRDEVMALPDAKDTLTDRPTPDCSFVILYTSGSTGRPKGCVLEQHNIVNFCHWYIRDFKVTAADRSVAYANFGFDAHMIDIYPLLACGGSVYILPSDMRMDLAAIHQYIEENKLTIAFFTTQIGTQLASLFEFSTIRLMSVGGEKLLPMKKPSFDFYNVYGPTECTLFSTFYPLARDYEDAPIGRPLAGYQLYVVDNNLHLLPRGMAGELCVAGEGVGREYLNNSKLTAEKFVTLNGKRMYRTGDLVKWNEAGNVVFLGRIDNQVKLRGLRIEIGEIESVLSRYEGIKSAAVDVKDINGVQMLCAYYCSDKTVDTDRLKAYLGESLTEFMVPEVYVHMDDMPLTPNGKVNRRALPLPKIEIGEIVKPETETEKQIFEIVAAQLGTDDFGVTTNLVSMGLTSIGAIKLSVLLQQRLNIHLSTKTMMKHPEIRQWIKSLNSDTDSDGQIQVYPKQKYYPLTQNQLGVYIDWEQHPDDLQYNIPYLLEFSGIKPEKLKQAIEQTLSAHPYIKVHLVMHEGEIMQERLDEAPADIKLIALEEQPTQEYFQSQIRPFNIIDHNLYDIRVYTYGSETWLLLNIHHIAFDGTSMNVLLRDIAKAYSGQELNTESITAYDYALSYDHWQKGNGYKEAEKYFDSIMGEVESVQYPASSSGTTQNGARKTRVSICRQSVAECAQRLGVTESSLVMATVMQALHRITREHHIMITTISNGRETTDLAATFGMFVQTLPVVSHFSGGSVAHVVKDMHRQMLATIDADKYPFTSLVERYGVSPQLMVAYQGDVLDDAISLGNSSGKKIPLHLDTVKTPVSIDVWNRADNQLEFEIEYDSSIYSEATMQTFGKAIAALLQRMSAADSETPVNSLAITTDEEQDRLMTLGMGPQVEMDVTKTFANLFVEQAHKTPDRLAVADANSELSYKEMDIYSNLLAHKFLEEGIKPDDLVCVMLERTKEFPLIVLSLHKCGAAYVPLDFEYPNQRLSFMLEDSESKLLITTHDVLEATLAEGEFNIGNAQPFFIDDIFADPGIKAKALEATPIDLSKPEGVAYMIYTSGSTGTPKGARLHQAGLHNFIATVIYMEKLTAADRISGHSSFSFDAHVEDMFPILTLGGSFHLMPSDIRKDLGEIRQFLFDHHITGGGYSTAVTCLLLNTFSDLPVRFITAGGEKLPPVYSDHIEILNTYGPTEGTVDATYYLIKPGERINEIPIGTTVANCWNFVVDETGNILPQGIPGELCFAGIQVSLGYWHREEQTAKVFGDCPFIQKDRWGRKVRMYHTGDLCRWNDDGQLEYISRIDTQVKLRGFRIELGEIENAVCRYEGIRSAIVVVKEIGGMQHLCAYYTADCEIDSNKLRENLSQSLTEYMVPDAYMQMDELPLTPNGKVNRKALPEPVIEQAAVSAYAEPEGEMETDIAEAYSKVLGIERISANDNFFTLGGTSVSAIKVVAALTLKDYKLSFKNIFECKTPRVLAAYLKGKADGASGAPVHQTVATEPDRNIKKSEFAQLLDANTIDSLSENESQPLGDVLLTGATGFMGIHFLRELIENETGRIYCILRGKEDMPAESRLRSLLFYYFDNTYEELFGKRIFVINGDVTDASTFDTLNIEADTAINCAANVKHFSAGDDIEKVNVEGVRNIIRWCLQTDTRLVQISTISIGGLSVDGVPSPDTKLTEHMFDFGQSLDNQYIKSKYNAEKLVFEAIRDNSLNAKILRVATLASRNADGEFQINFRTNGFMGRLRAFAQLGCVSYDMMDEPCEFSPIDEVCRASRLLAKTPRQMIVLHPCNNHTLPLGDVLRSMEVIGMKITPVERNEFNERVRKMMEDDSRSEFLQPILAYSNNSEHDVRYIDYSSSYTTQVLYRLGYYWPFTSWDYIERLVKSINGFGFFDKI